MDVAGGRAVRPAIGADDTDRGFGDPVEAALRWQAAGASWVHLVDVDAAYGRGHNRALLARTVSALDIDVEMSGGIVDDESLRAALASGCRRVVIGTAAVENDTWCAETIATHGERVAVGLDVRGDRLAPRGASRPGSGLLDALGRLEAAGCRRYVVTDVDRDGTLHGPNTNLLAEVCARTERPVVASGGIATVDDLRRLAALVAVGVEGAVVGTALHTGAFTLQEALAAVTAQPLG